MELVLFIGIQATGKTTFYLKRFFRTHVRINLDMLKTHRRETLLFRACFEGQIACVIDKMNLTVGERATYIKVAKAAGFRVIGYFFESELTAALGRNFRRDPPERIPEAGLRAARARLEVPTLDEGFDQLFAVRLSQDGFIVEATAR